MISVAKNILWGKFILVRQDVLTARFEVCLHSLEKNSFRCLGNQTVKNMSFWRPGSMGRNINFLGKCSERLLFNDMQSKHHFPPVWSIKERDFSLYSSHLSHLVFFTSKLSSGCIGRNQDVKFNKYPTGESNPILHPANLWYKLRRLVLATVRRDWTFRGLLSY